MARKPSCDVSGSADSRHIAAVDAYLLIAGQTKSAWFAPSVHNSARRLCNALDDSWADLEYAYPPGNLNLVSHRRSVRDAGDPGGNDR